jgi:hypothetical protein
MGSDKTMIDLPLAVGPFQGKTYSLYGASAGTSEYYLAVDQLADECLSRWPDPAALIAELAKASGSKRRLRRLLVDENESSPAGFVVVQAARRLAPFTEGVESHLRRLPLLKRWDRTIAASREQYHLHAVEIELTNRTFADAFKKSDTRLALLPHCLRDLRQQCEAAPHGLDDICMSCSSGCYLNAVSRMLRKHRVTPYIWMHTSLRKIFRQLNAKPGGLGMLGIACIPELAAGMRACRRAGVSVIGLPLDANRCVRWMGDFHDNTVNLERLEKLIG